MSDKLKKQLETWGVLVAILTGLSGFFVAAFAAFVLLPYRMDAAEKAIEKVAVERSVDHALLVQLAERMRWVDERTARMEKSSDERMQRIEQALDRLSK